jgi:hypothetical protein
MHEEDMNLKILFFVLALFSLASPAFAQGKINVVNPDGTREERQVMVGLTSRVAAEIITGLKEGEQVIAGVVQPDAPEQPQQQNRGPAIPIVAGDPTSSSTRSTSRGSHGCSGIGVSHAANARTASGSGATRRFGRPARKRALRSAASRSSSSIESKAFTWY